MESIEQEEGVCTVSYPNNSTMRDKCLSAYNGLLKKGISGTISYMIAHLTKEDLKFNDVARVRDLAILLELNTNPDTSAIIEVKVFLMENLFH